MKVIILEEGFIPGLGRGPYTEPTEISEDKFFLYKRMGLNIINVTERIPLAESGIRGVIRERKKSSPIMTTSISSEDDIIVENKKNIINETKTAETPVEEKTTTEKVSTENEEITTEKFSTENEKVTVEEPVEEETITTEEVLEDDVITEEELESLTKKQIIQLLKDNEIEVNPNLNKTELIAFALENL